MLFLTGGLGSSSMILHQCGKRVKTKCQKVLGANFYVCRNDMGNLVRAGCSFGLPHPKYGYKICQILRYHLILVLAALNVVNNKRLKYLKYL